MCYVTHPVGCIISVNYSLILLPAVFIVLHCLQVITFLIVVKKVSGSIFPSKLGFENSVHCYRAFHLAGAPSNATSAVPSLYLIFPARRGHHITFLSDPIGFHIKFLMYLPLKERYPLN